jgi:hypothetical protein
MLLFVFFIFISTIFHTLSVFYQKAHPNEGYFYVLIMGLLFAITQNMIRITSLYFYGKKIDNITIFTVINVCTLASYLLYSHFILHDTQYLISYVILLLSVGLIILNEYIVTKLKGKIK